MRIHTSTITGADIDRAITAAERIGDGRLRSQVASHASRKRDRAFEVRLMGDGSVSRRRTMDGQDYAATWCQWGAFLAELFDTMDANAIAGPYTGRENFHAQTRDLFADGKRPSGHAPRWDDERQGLAKNGELLIRPAILTRAHGNGAERCCRIHGCAYGYAVCPAQDSPCTHPTT